MARKKEEDWEEDEEEDEDEEEEEEIEEEKPRRKAGRPRKDTEEETEEVEKAPEKDNLPWQHFRQPEVVGIYNSKTKEVISDMWEALRRILSLVEETSKNTR